jgi:hypothetical protein
MRHYFMRSTEPYAYVKVQNLPSANYTCKSIPINPKSTQNIFWPI